MKAPARFAFLCAWQAGALAIFLTGCAVALELPPLAWGRFQAMDAWSLALGWILAAAAPSYGFLAGRRVRPALVLASGAAAFLLAWPLGPAVAKDWPWLPSFLHHFSDPGGLDWRLSLPRVAALAAFAILLNLGLAGSAGRARRLAWLAAAGLIGLAVLLLPGPLAALYRGLDQPIVREARSTLFPIRVSYFRGRIPTPEVNGGALQAIGDRLLLVTGDGRFHALGFDAPGSGLRVDDLPYRAPINTAEFRHDNPTLDGMYLRRFRVMDLLLTAAAAGESRLLVSHHFWDGARRCSIVRVSEFAGDPAAFLAGRADERWRTLWETSDCLPVDPGSERVFAGHQAGGTLLQDGAGRILLALGDQGFDGVHTAAAVSQDPDSEFGKIVSIDLAGGASRIYASGLRSPGDLSRAADGRVWFLDHGPRGGDELNLLADGANYGWPCRTLGAPYDGFGWQPPAPADCSGTFTDAVYAWTPSIGTASLIEPRGGGFEAWRGDLLVGGLASRGLARVIWLDGRPALSEAIWLNERVRALAEDDAGRIVAWTDSGALITLQAGDPSKRF